MGLTKTYKFEFFEIGLKLDVFLVHTTQYQSRSIMHMLLNHDVKHICDEVLKRTPSDCSLVNHGTQEEQDHTT